MHHLTEPARSIPVVSTCEVLVCGGGPAGVAAALAAARAGASTVLLEAHGCLGGVWTSGALTWIIDHVNKQGIVPEILARLEAAGGRGQSTAGQPNSGFHPEIMKTVLEALCREAGVRIRLHTRVVAALRDPSGQRLTHVITESKSGREAWQATTSIDCTGDGDLAAAVGCGFDMGRPGSGAVQPLSLLALVTGLNPEAVAPYLCSNGLQWGVPHAALKAEMLRVGVDPSYAYPTLFTLTKVWMGIGRWQQGRRNGAITALSRVESDAADACRDPFRPPGQVFAQLLRPSTTEAAHQAHENVKNRAK